MMQPHVSKTRGLTPQQKQELWERWKKGQSLSEIGRALGKHAGSITGMLAIHGGIAPPGRSRSARVLNTGEREEISRGLSAGCSASTILSGHPNCRRTAGLSLSQIADQIRRSTSTVSREIHRNGGRSEYRANLADQRAWMQSKRPKKCSLALNEALQIIVASKLRLDWSPEQVAGWLKRQFPDDKSMHVSHETIYRSLFIQARGVLKKELIKHLRSRRSMRRSRHSSSEEEGARTSISDAVSIRARPKEIEDRAIPGHWEGDLISGSKNSHIATLVERQSRFTMLVHVAGKDTTSVVSALCREVGRLPEELKKSLTWDRGGELGNHKAFTLATDMQVYFCDPQSPWQRGSNENTNRLLRQYFPKKTDISGYSQEELDAFSRKLNERSRKTLNYLTPAEKLQSIFALTG